MEQRILNATGEYSCLNFWFRRFKCVMLVCGHSADKLKINDYLQEQTCILNVKIIRFSDFSPNPTYESVTRGVELFRAQKCEAIIAIGGGSAIDVAKCIKLFSSMNGDGENGKFLHAPIIANSISLLAVPTTAGTGSESTKFAVIYYNGNKQSISDDSCIPEVVLFDSSFLETLPLYQKKSSMLDALCHAIESFWSVNSTEESRVYSRTAILKIIKSVDGYLKNTDEGNFCMLEAANIAGRAINITQTTAGHAMCYKITSMFGCAHGHAAALCVRILYRWMNNNLDKCIDTRGQMYLKNTLDEIGIALGGKDATTGAEYFTELFEKLEMEVPEADASQIDALKSSVNPDRLKNYPVELDVPTIGELYKEILKEKKYES